MHLIWAIGLHEWLDDDGIFVLSDKNTQPCDLDGWHAINIITSTNADADTKHSLYIFKLYLTIIVFMFIVAWLIGFIFLNLLNISSKCNQYNFYKEFLLIFLSLLNVYSNFFFYSNICSFNKEFLLIFLSLLNV